MFVVGPFSLSAAVVWLMCNRKTPLMAWKQFYITRFSNIVFVVNSAFSYIEVHSEELP